MTIKGILIKPYSMQVERVSMPDTNIEHIYHLLTTEWRKVDTFDTIRVGMVDSVYVTLFVDGESLIQETPPPENHFFKMRGYPDFLCGNGLLLGTDRAGETVDVPVHIMDVWQVTTFHKVAFDGFEDTEGVEVHPLFGKMNTFTRRAKFREIL
jgi:hypothetical protein